MERISSSCSRQVQTNFRADDRVLLLAIPDSEELATLARLLMRGVLVAIGDRDEVDEAREKLADFDNIMFLDARPDQIPWQEAYFSKIVVPPHLEPLMRTASTELYRLLAPGGEIVRQTVDA
jgi:hypothetical protein